MIATLPLWEPVARTLALVLLHFLWQGALVWLAAKCCLYVVPLRTPQVRYAVYAGLLGLLAMLPPVTLAVIAWAPASRYAEVVETTRWEEPPQPLVAFGQPGRPRVPMIEDREGALGWSEHWERRFQGSIVIAWLAGFVWMGARLVLGAIGVWAMVRRRQALPPSVTNAVERLAGVMNFGAPPAVYMVENVAQAMAVGMYRPLVLLPAAWILELPHDVLEAVIAHELAHLRRWDLPINFLQRLVETVLFFHPAVWWCSRQVRVEREMCCDDMAQRALGNRTLYAQALAYLAEHRQSARQPLLATGMGGLKMVLLERIRNVLGLGSVQHGRWYGPSCALIGAVIASVMWVVTLGFGPRHDESTAEPPYEIGFQASSDEPRDAATGLGAPTEMTKMTLPSYHIAPPDVLFIEAIRIIPKSPYHIQTGDELSVVFDLDEATLKSGRGFFVDPDGRISLGPLYGKVHVGGLTIDEATDVVLKRLRDVFKDPQVALSVVQTTGFQPITGEHLVSPDGMVSLGMYGQVRVAGMTLDEARAAVEQKLSFVLDHPQVSLSVFAYNSHVYYVISEGPSGGDFVTRLPSTGSETVLDAIAQVPGLTDLSRKRIWIARPSPGGKDTILKVNWIEITKGAATNKNFQVLPGDRIFVTERSMTRRSASVDRPTATSPPTTQAVRKFRPFDTLDRISMAD